MVGFGVGDGCSGRYDDCVFVGDEVGGHDDKAKVFSCAALGAWTPENVNPALLVIVFALNNVPVHLSLPMKKK